MSGILSALSSLHSPDAVIVLTDGAVYDNDGRLLTVKRKVTVSEKLPLAVAFRGNLAFGEVTSHQIIRAAEEVGFDRMLAALQADLPNMPTSPKLDILIAGVSEIAGVMHCKFTNVPGFKAVGVIDTEQPPPLALVDPGPIYVGLGGDGKSQFGLEAIGIPPPRKDETIEAWLARYGVNIFEWYRRMRVPVDPGDPNTDWQHLIGGILNMTVVKRSCVSTTLLHRWPDKIGERINPFGREAAAA
ncbi:hypothetical protein [Mesorhizobium sp.]|uniref:hypothetical protein n=1 Tax=Mesorhizobium sp. TaxID=1871066 RepID=UPI000FEA782E|nr:hypothetical protein [Mesorhizobium sp.]RWM28492.1 MAG: hypothetical protein EOR74_09185 [Mesorhizobium sp.]